MIARRAIATVFACAVASVVIAIGACAPRATPGGSGATPSTADTSFALPIEWLADSGRTGALPVEAPPEAWIARVTPSRPAPPEPPLPDALPAVPDAAPPPPALVIDPGLKPPIPRRAGRITAPAGARLPAWVELEVEVGADGHVGEVAWAAGSRDPLIVEAAIACARTMAFFPATRGGTPVAVWCRQRFDFQ